MKRLTKKNLTKLRALARDIRAKYKDVPDDELVCEETGVSLLDKDRK